jgi:hypothetical protein
MACVIKQRDRWAVDFYDQYGKRRLKVLPKGSTKKQARDLLREIEDHVGKGTFMPTKGSRKNNFTLSMEKSSSSNLAVGCIASVRFAPFACQQPFYPFCTVSCLEMRGSSVRPKFW